MSSPDGEINEMKLEFSSLKEIYLKYFHEREEDPTRGVRQEDKFTLEFINKIFLLVEKQHDMIQTLKEINLNLEHELNYKRLILNNKSNLHSGINDKVVDQLLDKITKQEKVIIEKQKEIDLCKSSNVTINLNQVQNNNCNLVNSSLGNNMAQSDYLTFSLKNENNSNCFDTLNQMTSFQSQKNDDLPPNGYIKFNTKLDCDPIGDNGPLMKSSYVNLRNLITPDNVESMTPLAKVSQKSFRKGDEFLGKIKQDNKTFAKSHKDSSAKRTQEKFDKLNKSPLPVKVFSKDTPVKPKLDKINQGQEEIACKPTQKTKILNTRSTARQIPPVNSKIKLKANSTHKNLTKPKLNTSNSTVSSVGNKSIKSSRTNTSMTSRKNESNLSLTQKLLSKCYQLVEKYNHEVNQDEPKERSPIRGDASPNYKIVNPKKANSSVTHSPIRNESRTPVGCHTPRY